MSELVIVALFIGFIWLLARMYRSYMIRQTKFKLGIAQILSDGTVVETMDHQIEADSTLPFEGRLLALFFATYLIMREQKDAGNWTGLISAYLFKWEMAGLITSEHFDESVTRFTFHDGKKPIDAIEIELYDILKSNLESGFDFDLLQDWSQKVLAMGEKELLETSDVAFDAKGRIRFTSAGYDRSLSHGRFAKYWRSLSAATVCEKDETRLFQELSVALLLNLTEEIESFAIKRDEVSEMLLIANRVWRF